MAYPTIVPNGFSREFPNAQAAMDFIKSEGGFFHTGYGQWTKGDLVLMFDKPLLSDPTIVLTEYDDPEARRSYARHAPGYFKALRAAERRRIKAGVA